MGKPRAKKGKVKDLPPKARKAGRVAGGGDGSVRDITVPAIQIGFGDGSVRNVDSVKTSLRKG